MGSGCFSNARGRECCGDRMCSLVVIIASRSMAAGADKHIQDATTWFRGDTGVRLRRCRPSANTADSEAKSHGVLILY